MTKRPFLVKIFFMPKQLAPQKRAWYAIQTYAGYEEIVAESLRQRVENLGLENKIFNILVPKEKKIKVKRGKREVVEEKILPSYVLVEMIVDDESWYVVRNTPNVTGFVGTGKVPLPLKEEEVREILKRVAPKEPEVKIDLKVGEIVKIISGPFKDFEGKISEIDKERGKVKVLVTFFGTDTFLELDCFQVKKI